MYVCVRIYIIYIGLEPQSRFRSRELEKFHSWTVFTTSRYPDDWRFRVEGLGFRGYCVALAGAMQVGALDVCVSVSVCLSLSLSLSLSVSVCECMNLCVCLCVCM